MGPQIFRSRELAVTGLRLLLVEHGEVMAAAWPGKILSKIINTRVNGENQAGI
jgi:phosphatidylglycerophosphate synthase